MGDWFGWSVKLQLLDRDDDGTEFFPEPVLFVGAPKANGGVGYVKVFAFDETVIQTLTPADVTAPVIQAFGYSLDAKSHPLFRFSHLIVGAPETNSGKGAIFIYRWQDRQYVLKGVFAIEVAPTVPAGVSGSQVDLQNMAYNEHFGAEVGAFYFDSTFPRFYAVSYDSGRTGTSIQFFFSNASGSTTREIGAYSTVYSGVEYGSFFTIPVKVWKVESSFRGGIEEFFPSKAEAIKRSLVFLGEKAKTSVKTVSLELLGVLKREDNGALKSKYAAFYPDTVAGSLTTFLGGVISIDTGTGITDVDAGFTNLYTTTNKLSFAALTDKLFIAQGASVYSTSLTVNQSGIVEFVAEGALKPVVFPSVFRFTGITAISVLKFADDKFYLAVGEATDNSNAGRAVVFEGTNAEFSDIEQTFRVTGAAGDWFGWSVKLQLLDRDGAGSGTPEPVLFVGAPKAPSSTGTSEVGTVKVFAVADGVDRNIQTIRAPPALTYVRAFGYSLAGGIHATTNNYLFVGAPKSTHSGTEQGAAFVYKWNNEVGGSRSL